MAKIDVNPSVVDEYVVHLEIGLFAVLHPRTGIIGDDKVSNNGEDVSPTSVRCG